MTVEAIDPGGAAIWIAPAWLVAVPENPLCRRVTPSSKASPDSTQSVLMPGISLIYVLVMVC
jgi:hypothetical protein